jgi:hypothetical protein
MYLSSVPPESRMTSVIDVRYLLRRCTSSSGVSFSEKDVNPCRSEKWAVMILCSPPSLS